MTLQNIAKLTVLIGLLWVGSSTSTVANNSAKCIAGFEFSWGKLPPSKSLQWTDCAQGRQCARLIVPLNYSDPEGDEAIIALVRKPASSLGSDSNLYRGPLLINPGGPGGSGVDTVMGPGGDYLSTIAGPQFDIVGFDPRGISRSTPRVSIFETDVERELWGGISMSVVNNSDDGIARTWARAQVTGRLAAESDTGYLRHINTENTARDMLRIVEAHGRKRLQYWGFSYGTIIGSVFASLFPDNVERMVLDGVTDAEDYFTAILASSLQDTNKALDNFFSTCADAGPDGCAFWAPTADDIRQNLTRIYDSVRARPIPVSTGSLYGIFDYAKLRIAVLRSLYNPFVTFPILAQGLAELSAGTADLLFRIWNPPAFECSCDTSTHMFDNVGDGGLALCCNDAENVPGDLQSSQNFFDEAIKISDWFEIYSSIRISCSGWPKFEKTHFRGPIQGNTSHPIMFIGNTADPVTPLASAKKIARGFPGSVVLTQNSTGHCSNSAPSLCTQQYVRKYFDDGTVPPPNTVCQVLGTPFPTANARLDVVINDQVAFNDRAGTSPEVQELLDAVMALSQTPIATFSRRANHLTSHKMSRADQ